MAEAVVGGTAMSRFFCHKCSVEIEHLLPDYTCPNCSSGFIEELENRGNGSGSGMDVSNEDLGEPVDVSGYGYDFSQSFDPEQGFTEIIFGIPVSGRTPGGEVRRGRASGGRSRVHWPRDLSDPRRPGSTRGRQVPMPIENLIQDFILNLTGVGLGLPMGQGGRSPVLFLGNPGDYVWGRDGLDAIVTQLLNQMDGTGPPPLPQKKIDEIPTALVSQDQVDIKLQCSVCWEDFILSEPVRQLPCLHFYHAPCIVPWLELHGTCPICRQSLGDQNSAEANQDTVGPSLAALFRAANESSRTASESSTSSSSGSSSSNDSTNEI